MNKERFETGKKLGLLALALMLLGGVFTIINSYIGGLFDLASFICAIMAYVKSFGFGTTLIYSFKGFIMVAKELSLGLLDRNRKKLEEFGRMRQSEYCSNIIWSVLVYVFATYIWVLFIFVLPYVVVKAAKKALVAEGRYEQ